MRGGNASLASGPRIRGRPSSVRPGGAAAFRTRARACLGTPCTQGALFCVCAPPKASANAVCISDRPRALALLRLRRGCSGCPGAPTHRRHPTVPRRRSPAPYRATPSARVGLPRQDAGCLRSHSPLCARASSGIPRCDVWTRLHRLSGPRLRVGCSCRIRWAFWLPPGMRAGSPRAFVYFSV